MTTRELAINATEKWHSFYDREDARIATMFRDDLPTDEWQVRYAEAKALADEARMIVKKAQAALDAHRMVKV